LTVTPSHLGISHQFWLFPDIDATSTDTPYGKAIANLKKITNLQTPSSKLRCLIDTGKMIVTCIDSHWKGQKKGDTKFIVGGDELLPIFAYVIIKADVPCLFTESKFVEAFVSEEEAMQEGGKILYSIA
jgi:hypothetical protein